MICNHDVLLLSEIEVTDLFVVHSAVDFVCDHPAIQAISFVGSDRVGKYIYDRGSANGKRVQSNMVCTIHHSNTCNRTAEARQF